MNEASRNAGLPAASRVYAENLAADQPLDLGDMGCTHPPERPKNLWVPVSFEEAAAAFLMAVLAGITLLNVVTRYLTNISFAFTEEYSVILLFVLVFVGISSAIVKNTHIKVTFFTDMLPVKWQRAADIFGLAAMIVCFAVLIIYGTGITVDSYELEETSPGLGNPQWIYYAALPIFSAIACLRALGALIRIVFAREGDAR